MGILPELTQLFNSVKDGNLSEEDEKQLAMNIIRKAKDQQAKEEIG